MVGKSARSRATAGQPLSVASSNISPLCRFDYSNWGLVVPNRKDSKLIFILLKLCRLDDDVWDVRLNLEGCDNLDFRALIV